VGHDAAVDSGGWTKFHWGGKGLTLKWDLKFAWGWAQKNFHGKEYGKRGKGRSPKDLIQGELAGRGHVREGKPVLKRVCRSLGEFLKDEGSHTRGRAVGKRKEIWPGCSKWRPAGLFYAEYSLEDGEKPFAKRLMQAVLQRELRP